MSVRGLKKGWCVLRCLQGDVPMSYDHPQHGPGRIELRSGPADGSAGPALGAHLQQLVPGVGPVRVELEEMILQPERFSVDPEGGVYA